MHFKVHILCVFSSISCSCVIGFEPYDNIISLNCEYHEYVALHIRNWVEFANCYNLAADMFDAESDDDTLEYGPEHMNTGSKVRYKSEP